MLFPIVPSKCKITRKSALKMIGRAQKCPQNDRPCTKVPFSQISTLPPFNPGKNTDSTTRHECLRILNHKTTSSG